MQRHHPRRLQLRVRVRERVADRLVGADRPVEHDAVLGVGDGAVERDLADAARLGRQQDALGVEAVEEVPEALALLADEPPALDRAGRRTRPRTTPPRCARPSGSARMST